MGMTIVEASKISSINTALDCLRIRFPNISGAFGVVMALGPTGPLESDKSHRFC